MNACRFLPLLVLSCALDLAVPVAPTPAGVEFEDDAEAIHTAAARDSRPRPAALRAATRLRVDLRERARLSPPSAPAGGQRPEGNRQAGRAHLSASDRAAPPAPSGEDH